MQFTITGSLDELKTIVAVLAPMGDVSVPDPRLDQIMASILSLHQKVDAMSDINQQIGALGKEIELEATEIGQLVAVDQQLRQELKDAMAAAKNSPTPETLQILENALAKAQANSQAMADALKAGSASGQAAV